MTSHLLDDAMLRWNFQKTDLSDLVDYLSEG